MKKLARPQTGGSRGVKGDVLTCPPSLVLHAARPLRASSSLVPDIKSEVDIDDATLVVVMWHQLGNSSDVTYLTKRNVLIQAWVLSVFD